MVENSCLPTYTLLRNPDAFDNPIAYNPDRWMTGDKEKMAKAHFPFSTGPRACIGRNIAYFERLLVISTLVRLFDFDFLDKSFGLETLEWLDANHGELVLSCRRRSPI
jgi:cytochrome P450